MKWGLVVAGLADMSRPVENVSIPQCTGKQLQFLSRHESFQLYLILPLLSVSFKEKLEHPF